MPSPSEFLARARPVASDFSGPEARLNLKREQGETFGTSFLKDSIAKSKPFEAQANRLRAQAETGVANIGGRLNRVRAGANLAVQRDGSGKFGGGPRGFSRQLEQNLKRGKARQGINARGEKAIRNQQLKDRIMMAKGGVQRLGQLNQTASDAANLRAGGNASAAAANSAIKASRAGAIGSIAGAAARGFGDKLFDTGDLSSGMVDQQNDFDSFFDLGAGDVGGLSTNGFDFSGGILDA